MSRLKLLLLSGTVVLTGFAGVAVAQNATVATKTQDRLPVRIEMAATYPFIPVEADGLGGHPAREESRPLRLAGMERPDGPMMHPGMPGPDDDPHAAHMDRRFGPPPPDADEAGPEAEDGPQARGPGWHRGRHGPGMGPGMGAGMGPGMMGRPMRPFPGPGMQRPGPLAFAGTLAAAETALGIRADQIDAWRAFTDALQAAATPPLPPPAAASADTPPSPLAAFAARLASRGEAGARLSQSLAALKEKLRPDQLARFEALEPELLPGPRWHHRR